MNGEGRTALARETVAKPGVFQCVAVSGVVDSGQDVSLVVDRSGRVVRCDGIMERILGMHGAQLTGRKISEFVIGLFLGGSSPSYGERYLAYLCAGGDWRRFEARDGKGKTVSVEINLSRKVVDGQEFFLLKLRDPMAAASNA